MHIRALAIVVALFIARAAVAASHDASFRVGATVVTSGTVSAALSPGGDGKDVRVAALGRRQLPPALLIDGQVHVMGSDSTGTIAVPPHGDVVVTILY